MKNTILLSLTLTLCCIAAKAYGDCSPKEIPQAYFGDLHVHTTLSNDANGMGLRARPADAYRFALGESLAVNKALSITPKGKLDFAAVTDHAEQLGAATLCHDPESATYQRWSCRLERSRPRLGLLLGTISGALWGEPGGPHCAENACTNVQLSAWDETVKAAETFDKPCEFTSFVAYEWSGNGNGGATIHRNVIFNQNPDIDQPFGADTFKTPEQLFEQLRAHCVDQDTGCDALTIPHNSNLSKGQMFPRRDNTESIDAGERAYFDRLAEIIQHKGASECYSGVISGMGSVDEACGFEALPYASFLGKFLPLLGSAPENDTSFLREGLKEGLRFDTDNPYQLGLIGSTDTHLGTPGQVDEQSYREHHNKNQRIGSALIPKQPELNPGGLAVIYARNNTRADLFDAMKRREVYATSGTRIGLRFFAGDKLPDNLCTRPKALEFAYKHGQPMGGTIAEAKAPSFFVMATKAPHGQGLHSLQLVKGWMDASGETHEKVISLVDTPSAGLDEPSSCEAQAPAESSICAQWRDPEFNPQQKSFYYVRVLEKPGCRWNQAICSRLPTSDAAEAASCKLEQSPIQERAWSSPIWLSQAKY